MKEYYNVLDSGYRVFGFASIGLVMIAIGIIAVIIMKNNNNDNSQQIFMYLWISFGVLWTTVAFISTGSEYFSCTKAIENGTYQEVEGFVENFEPMPHGGHKNESFTVNDVKFEYSDFKISAGFNNTKSHGGPIDEGKYVRIKYYNDIILQIWVRE